MPPKDFSKNSLQSCFYYRPKITKVKLFCLLCFNIMIELKKVYFSIGSNLGNRLQNLQTAVFLLGNGIGKVRNISKVYESPSWGFDAPDFLNACLEIETNLTPSVILEKILLIEKKWAGYGLKKVVMHLGILTLIFCIMGMKSYNPIVFPFPTLSFMSVISFFYHLPILLHNSIILFLEGILGIYYRNARIKVNRLGPI